MEMHRNAPFVSTTVKHILGRIQPLPKNPPGEEGINHLPRTMYTRSAPCGLSTAPRRLKTWWVCLPGPPSL